MLLICMKLNASVLQAQDIDSTATKEKSLWGSNYLRDSTLQLPHIMNVFGGTNIGSAGGSSGLIFGQIRRFRGSCVDTDEIYKVIKNGVIVEWSFK
jgi:hypothetical protein